jgi:hypothetical protein
MRVEDVLTHLPRVDVGAEAADSARTGRSIDTERAPGDVLVVGPDGAVGVFASGEGVLRPVTVLGR